MARFGLVSNPIEAGVDTFAKLSNVFRQNDQMQLEQQKAEDNHQEAAQRQQLAGLQMQTAQNTLDDQELQKPVKQAQYKEAKMKADHAVLQPLISSAMVKNFQAQKDGTMPEYSAQEIDAILHLNTESPLFDDDPKVAVGQTAAMHNLQQTMATVTPALVQHAQQLPEGQRKVRIADDNAPGVVESFNVAFKRLLGGKEAESFLVDMDKGAIVPVVKGKDGAPEPLIKNGQVSQIPIALLQQYIGKGAAFGNLLLPALAQTEGNDKLAEEVRKAGELRQVAQAKAKALEKVPEDTDPVEARKLYTKAMGDAGYSVTPAEVKELFPDKKARNLMKMTEGVPGNPTQKREFLVDQDNPEKRVITGNPLEEFNPATALAVADRQARAKERADDKKDKEAERRRDKLVKEKLALINKDPEWSSKEFAERQDEAQRQADAQIEGKPAPRQAGGGDVKTLSTWMKGLSPEGRISGTDMAATIKGAIEKGHSIESLKAAANSLPAKTPDDIEKKDQLLKAISAQGTKPAAVAQPAMPARNSAPKQPQASQGKIFTDSLPDASKYAPVNGKSKIATDTKTGKRYKSDGKRWVELPQT